jgi:hypothetical protein
MKEEESIKIFQHPKSAFRIIDEKAAIIIPGVNELFVLNSVGTRIWQLCTGKTPQEILATLVQEFDVTPQKAKKDLNTFIQDMLKRGMIEIQKDEK